MLLLSNISVSVIWFIRIDQLERQLHHAQPKLAIVLRPIVAGGGQMLQERVNDRIERASVYGVQLGLAWLLGDRRLLWMTVGAGVGVP